MTSTGGFFLGIVGKKDPGAEDRMAPGVNPARTNVGNRRNDQRSPISACHWKSFIREPFLALVGFRPIALTFSSLAHFPADVQQSGRTFSCG